MLDLGKIEETPHLLDVLLSMEDVLDSLDLYVFKNWINGEVVEGPTIRRHWTSFSLLYPHNKMPDPKAAFRLIKHGIKVEFNKVEKQKDSFAPVADKSKEHSFWMVKLEFPRRLLDQNMEMGDVEEYEDEVEIDDVETGQDDGLNDMTGLTNGNFDGSELSPDEQENATNVQPI